MQAKDSSDFSSNIMGIAMNKLKDRGCGRDEALYHKICRRWRAICRGVDSDKFPWQGFLLLA